jgi:fatty acid desaturase
MHLESQPLDRILDRSALAEDVRELSTLSSWRAIRAIGFQWAVIGAAAGVAIVSGHWIVYLLAIAVIGTRQHAIAVLAHEGAHHRLFRVRRTNDIVSDLMLAFTMGVSTRAYRKTHLGHHSHTATDQDPDVQFARQSPQLWGWPKPPREALVIFLKDLLGINAVLDARMTRWSAIGRLSPQSQDPLSPLERALFVSFVAAALVGLALTGWWWQVVVLWAVPAVTVFPTISRLRAIAEHMSLEGRSELNATREMLPSVWDRLLVAPCNVNYHLSHHLFPSVPFYNLPALHARLMKEPEFRKYAHITRGYFDTRRGLLSEVLIPAPEERRPGVPPAAPT